MRTGGRAGLGWLGRGWLVVLSTHALFFVLTMKREGKLVTGLSSYSVSSASALGAGNTPRGMT